MEMATALIVTGMPIMKTKTGQGTNQAILMDDSTMRIPDPTREVMAGASMAPRDSKIHRDNKAAMANLPLMAIQARVRNPDLITRAATAREAGAARVEATVIAEAMETTPIAIKAL
jgi:hypothetical protein